MSTTQKQFSPKPEKLQKIETDLTFICRYYHFHLNEPSVLTDSFKTYTYNKKRPKVREYR